MNSTCNGPSLSTKTSTIKHVSPATLSNQRRREQYYPYLVPLTSQRDLQNESTEPSLLTKTSPMKLVSPATLPNQRRREQNHPNLVPFTSLQDLQNESKHTLFHLLPATQHLLPTTASSKP